MLQVLINPENPEEDPKWEDLVFVEICDFLLDDEVKCMTLFCTAFNTPSSEMGGHSSLVYHVHPCWCNFNVHLRSVC